MSALSHARRDAVRFPDEQDAVLHVVHIARPIAPDLACWCGADLTPEGWCENHPPAIVMPPLRSPEG